MYKQFTVMGNSYHDNKKQFKDYLKTLNICWNGSMSYYKWQSKDVTVIAEFKRDEDNDITLEALFKINGNEPDFSKVCKWIQDNLTPIPTVQESESPELKLWIQLHEPNYESYERTGAPKGYIEFQRKNFEKLLIEKKKSMGIIV